MLSLKTTFERRVRKHKASVSLMEGKKKYLSANISRGFLPCAHPLTIHAVSKAARKPRAQPVPIGQKGCEQETEISTKETTRLKNPINNTKVVADCAADLQQTIAHQGHHKLVSVLLPDQGGVLGGVHARDVKHGHVGLTVVVDGVVQRRQLVVCAEVGRLASVGEQRFVVDVAGAQQALRLRVVLFVRQP